jgi:uncharacterized protein (DUF58 family)
MMAEERLLDPQFLRRLERMQVVSKRMARGTQAGKRRSRNTGSSVEFADYRAYAPGDDLRQLDWNAYARTGKLFLKKFLDEQELHISLYIDCSRSMAYGEPSKFQRAVQLAAALGYISLHHFDYVSVYAFDDKISASLRSLHGKGKVQQLFRFLQSLQPGGAGEINQALRSAQAVHGKPGISVIVSDFLYETGYEQGIAFLQAARQEVALVQLLTKEERDPQYEGGLRLIDSETQQQKEISFNPLVLDEYRGTVKTYQAQLAGYAFSRGISYLDVEPERPVEEILFHICKQSGLIR